MHPDFRQHMIRRRERELSAAARDAHAREERRKENEDPLAVRLVFAGPEQAYWPGLFASFMIAGR
jgi:hypothetical protein